MRKTVIISSVLLILLSATLQAQGIVAEDLELSFEGILVKDFDNDQIKDTVYFDYKNSVIVCNLSSQNFKPITSMFIENCWSVADSEDGFRVNISCGDTDWLTNETTINTTMSFPEIYLETFDENICCEYSKKSIDFIKSQTRIEQ